MPVRPSECDEFSLLHTGVFVDNGIPFPVQTSRTRRKQFVGVEGVCRTGANRSLPYKGYGFSAWNDLGEVFRFAVVGICESNLQVEGLLKVFQKE